MDYALLAATALGAIGLYLMLPRERAPLVRLGALLSVLALAGFFLYLVRVAGAAQAAAAAHGGGGMWAGGPPVIFYVFAFIMIAGAVGVVCQPKPVYAALYFVLVTLAGAGIFVLLLAEFMAIVLVIIYAGAILVTYVFVIMLASQGTGSGAAARAPLYDRRAAEPFISVLVAFVLIGTVLQMIFPVNGAVVAVQAREPDALMMASDNPTVPPGPEVATSQSPALSTLTAETNPAETSGFTPSNVQMLGVSLYSKYALSLELAGILLTISLVGAVVIARKGTPSEEVLGRGHLPTE